MRRGPSTCVLRCSVLALQCHIISYKCWNIKHVFASIFCKLLSFTSPPSVQTSRSRLSFPSTKNPEGAKLSAMQGDWKVNVKFAQKGLQATASGVLLVPPEDALALVTDAAGDSLFRVVQRVPLPAAADGSQRVEVINKAAIRVLAWKIWTSNKVVYQIEALQPSNLLFELPNNSSSGGSTDSSGSSSGSSQQTRTVSFNLLSSNMLHRLHGTWKLQPIQIHQSNLHHTLLHPSSSSNSTTGCKPSSQATLSASCAALSLSTSTANSNSGCGGDSSDCNKLAPGLSVDAAGNVTATLVQYEQYAQPKGLPPGVRFVPGMSDAVRSSIAREVRQMLDKINYVAMLEVHQGLTPQAALLETAQQLEAAGGSFKKLPKHLGTTAAAAVAAAVAAAAVTEDSGAGATAVVSVSRGNSSGGSMAKKRLEAHPLELSVTPLS